MSSEETSAFYSTLALEKVESDDGAIAAGTQGNGFYDSFSALTYVDTAGATNLDGSTAGELKPALSSGSQAGLDTLANLNLYLQSTGNTEKNITQAISAAALTLNGTKVRFLLRGPTSGSCTLTGMTIGHRAAAGDAWDTEATPVAVTVGGNAAFTLAANVSTWSDWVMFALVETKALLCKYHFNTNGNVRFTDSAPTGFTYYTKSGASEIGTANVSGYNTGADSYCFLVEQIQVASPQDLDVKSSEITLSTAPDWAELYAFVAPNTAALNTDLIMSVSRDGANFQALTMAERYTRPDGTRVISSGRTTMSAASGTSGKWRIQSDNGKLPVVKAVGILFGEDA